MVISYLFSDTLWKIFESNMCYWTRELHSCGYNHHHFCECLSEIEAEYPESPILEQLYSLVGVKFYTIFELRAETEIFLNKNCPQPLLLSMNGFGN